MRYLYVGALLRDAVEISFMTSPHLGYLDLQVVRLVQQLAMLCHQAPDRANLLSNNATNRRRRIAESSLATTVVVVPRSNQMVYVF